MSMPLINSRLVRRCFAALQRGLPEVAVHELFVHWEQDTRNGNVALPDGNSEAMEWARLMSLLLPIRSTPGNTSLASNSTPDLSHSLYNYIPRVMEVLHLLYEDSKLCSYLEADLWPLADFLYTAALCADSVYYKRYYLRQFPELLSQPRTGVYQLTDTRLIREIETQSLFIPSIFAYMRAVLPTPTDATEWPLDPPVVRFPHIAGVNDRSRDMVDLMRCIQRSDAFLSLLVRRGYTREILFLLPVEVRDRIYLALDNLRQTATHGQEAAVYSLLRRPDLHEHAVSAGVATSGSLRVNPLEQQQQQHLLGDGTDSLDDELLRVYFPFGDGRMATVRSYLDSTKLLLIDGPRDDRGEQEREQQLFRLLRRTLALPTGRGMLTMFTSTKYDENLMNVPDFCYTGRDSLEGTIIERSEYRDRLRKAVLCSSFHNGVAAGLRLCPDVPLSLSWIQRTSTDRCTSQATVEQGGLLLAWGLSAHLRHLCISDITEFTCSSVEPVRIGALLGLAAAYRGTREPSTVSVMDHVGRHRNGNMQSVALFGLGLLSQGTGERNTVHLLLTELELVRSSPNNQPKSFFLSVGLAVGLVLLGRGDQLDIGELRDLEIVTRLDGCMRGGQAVTTSVEALTKMMPGPTLALGLTFFGTGNWTITAMLKLPRSGLIINFPHHLIIMRIVAQHLIHWDAITPAQCREQQDEVNTIARMLDRYRLFDIHETTCRRDCEANLAILCGTSVALGLRFAGTADPVAADTLHDILRFFTKLRNSPRTGPGIGAHGRLAQFVDIRPLEDCQLMTLLALSLVVAGTGDMRVLRAVRALRSQNNARAGVTYVSHVTLHMALGFAFLGGGRYTLSRSPPAIAAIVTAILPDFALLSAKNINWVVQALRHLYVLAVEPRLIIPRRIDNGRLTQCFIRFARRDHNIVEKRLAPCMLPELHTLEWVELCDPNFFQVRFDSTNWNLLE
ncbi:meiotic checkpoint regulator cut4 [Anopheles sinensis]|uniref:Meiotic checkpoint regulator cut4 n=1 Tax=Anopheles sinensis TaxID=74873 RepID=A0A084VVL8_ANOSI|nr:meiotic checkpoint regulator cut4 [Anopheles sinensis]